jgi:predicted ester cyclase
MKKLKCLTKISGIMKNLFNQLTFISLILVSLSACKTEPSEDERMIRFGNDYTTAWNSMVPDSVASFYAEDGSLTINNGAPSEGRAGLATTANSFMEAFPDMHLVMDSLVADGNTYRYHWRFTGSFTGPGGNGNKVDFTGFERWTMNDDGLIQRSIGTFDAVDYNRQLRGD